MDETQKDTQTPESEAPQTAPEAMMQPETPEHGERTWLGPAVGVLIVLLVLVLGGLYLWGSSQTREDAERAEADAEEIEMLESELAEIDDEFDNLDEDFAEIDAALESEFEGELEI